MSHSLKFFAAAAVAVLTHLITAKLHEAIQFFATGDLKYLEAGLPWSAIAVIFLCLIALLVALWLKSSIYKNWGLASLGIGAIISVQYLSVAIGHPHFSLVENIAAAAALLSLIFIWTRIHHLKPGAVDRQRFKPLRLNTPEARPGLIVFLSFLTGSSFKGQNLTTHQISDGAVTEDPRWVDCQHHINQIIDSIITSPGASIANEKLLEPLGTLNIRMPLEAIRVQLALGSLTNVVVIPSRDSPINVPNGPEPQMRRPFSGSNGQAKFFELATTRLFTPLSKKIPQFTVVQGVDFEEEAEITGALSKARTALNQKDASRHNVDITGGQALCSIVGAVMSLDHDDRITYVSTRDYKSRSYDFEPTAVVEP